MEKFSVNEVIEQAVQTERLGYQFYSSMAKKFEKEEAFKKLFETLAQKELRHEKTFSELKEITGNEEPEGWEDVSRYLRAIVESEFFLGRDKSLPSLAHVKSSGDAVNFAMGFEKDTILYYHEIRNIIKEKDIVDEIINEEKSHIMWLNKFKGSYVSSK